MRVFAKTLVAILTLVLNLNLSAQEQVVVIPKPVAGAPFAYFDQADLFSQAYHLFREGLTIPAIDSLRKLLYNSGVPLDLRNYYLVVANFTDELSPIGLLHEGSNFFDTRLYGLDKARLYYLFISRQRRGASFVSTLLTAKNSPFLQNLPQFVGMFFPFLPSVRALQPDTTWIDVREYDIPPKFRKFSTISVIVKASLEAEKRLATASFDNTAKEHWSFGVATAVTSAKDVDFAVGNDGVIIIRPKRRGDLGSFAVINFHFYAVDTRAKSLATSFHLLGGLRLARVIEPILGIGFGVPVGFLEAHLFAGYSVEVTQVLKSGFKVGDRVEVDPFKTKFRGKPRLGLELKFP
ncbi:MAG: hypothetical protein ONB44_02920 [candidate division KSB1 bacterium]|nr:hypothetical protein [candidate division KSB1 bacterium]MDZ7301078.1 hypothetical protein [candidate division KSB1 bacterium]MDZ7312098.1 hypothetical protein [candidate division KSB1 bacterium]